MDGGGESISGNAIGSNGSDGGSGGDAVSRNAGNAIGGKGMAGGDGDNATSGNAGNVVENGNTSIGGMVAALS